MRSPIQTLLCGALLAQVSANAKTPTDGDNSSLKSAVGDRFMDFARANGLDAVGHCLVWAKDDRTDEWMMREAGGGEHREELAQDRKVTERAVDRQALRLPLGLSWPGTKE